MASLSARAVVTGTDLPLKMPIAAMADVRMDLPESLRAQADAAPITLLSSYAVPIILAGRDLAVIGAEPTGAEQVTPILLPIIAASLLDERASPQPAADSPTKEAKSAARPRTLVLCPTRALATFAAHEARELARGTSLRIACACGGETIDASVAECTGGGGLSAAAAACPEVLLIATPGRLVDLLERGAVALSAVRHLGLVNVDALFDAGYDDHLRRLVVQGLPSISERQTTLTCAALPAAVTRVSSFLLRSSHVKLTAPKPWLAATRAPLARQAVRFADERGKPPALAELLAVDASAASTYAYGKSPHSRLALVLVASRRHCEMVTYFLQGEGVPTGGLPHERLKRAEKEQVLSDFASGATRVLVATDASMRSVSTEQLPPIGHVIGFDFPASMDEYAARLALTARGGHSGRATTFVNDATPREQLEALAEVLTTSGNEVPRWLEGMATAAPTPVAVQ